MMIQQPMPIQVAPMIRFVRFVPDPMALLATAQKARVKQKFEYLEVISGCEMQNEYYVSCEDAEGNRQYLFKAKEISTWACRTFCVGAIREFKLDLKKIEYTSQGQEKKTTFSQFDRPFRCTCCCCNHPEMSGQLFDQNPPFIGKITVPCYVCDPVIQIWNKTNTLAYTITINCCQCGFCNRKAMFGKCSEVVFDIFTGSHIEGKKTGIVHKKVKGVQSAIGDADFYTITLPPEATPVDKLLMIGAIINIDYLYFEDKDRGK